MTLSGEERFDLKRQLADTLQGRIYSAIDRRTGEWVVVKETWKQLVQLGKSRDGHPVPEDFHSEKKIMKYLTDMPDADECFVKFIEEWDDDNCHMYAMEMCQGGELFEYIKVMHSKGAVAHFTAIQAKLPQELMKVDNEWIGVVKHMFGQIVKCVAWMHSHNVCHLDLSLENTMIASKKTNLVKIIDFGLGRRYADGKFTGSRRVGKLGYMSPEVYAKSNYDARAADIWSLGVMLFMMLIGAPPYKLPLANNPAFNFIVHGKLGDVLKHWKRLRLVTTDALDLMNKIFCYEPKRIKMREILDHPFVGLTEYVPGMNAAKKNINVVDDVSVNNQTIAADIENQPPNEEISAAEVIKTEPAQNFAKQLVKELNLSDLRQILENVERTQNKFHSKQNANAEVQLTIKELAIIRDTVNSRLEDETHYRSEVSINQNNVERTMHCQCL